MTDIVERLRAIDFAYDEPVEVISLGRLINEAANTIVLLRADKAQIALSYDQALKEIERLRNEIDRMVMINDGHR